MKLESLQQLCALLLLSSLSSSNKLQASKRDAKFWNINRILNDEPNGQWPSDALNCPYVDNDDVNKRGMSNWDYWYRRDGMQTSTDDVIVALVAAYPEIMALKSNGSSSIDLSSLIWSQSKATESAVNSYVDLGCGIGSTLLLVANILRPKVISLGVEAQQQSVSLLQRTISELPVGAPQINILHKDLRELLKSDCKTRVDGIDGSVASHVHSSGESILDLASQIASDGVDQLIGRCDLITANPPYATLQSGTLCKDAQRRSARFELRGGVEEYLITAKALLSPKGRFVLAFWSRDHERVRKAVHSADLRIARRFDVLMGQSGRTSPHLSVYDVRPTNFSNSGYEPDSISNPSWRSDPKASPNISSFIHEECEVLQLDITRDPISGGLNKNYESIRKLLKCANRPLKQSRKKDSS